MTIAPQSDAPVCPEDKRSQAPSVTPEHAIPDSDVRAPFGELVQRHQTMIWRYLRLLGADAHEADDLMQDAFVRLGEGLARGEQVLSPPSFLRGVARNLLIGRRRRQRRQAPTVAWADAVDALVQEPRALADERVAALRRCIDDLGGRVRSAVEWHHIDGLSYREAASRLGIKEQGIKSLLARARVALRACIERRMAREERP